MQSVLFFLLSGVEGAVFLVLFDAPANDDTSSSSFLAPHILTHAATTWVYVFTLLVEK